MLLAPAAHHHDPPAALDHEHALRIPGRGDHVDRGAEAGHPHEVDPRLRRLGPAGGEDGDAQDGHGQRASYQDATAL